MKDYTTPYSKWLALALLIFHWLTGNVEMAEQNRLGFVGHIIGLTLSLFILSSVILLVLRLFGVAWRAKVFFFMALGFAVLGALGSLKGV